MSHWPHINVSDFDALIVIDFKRFVYKTRWTLNRNWLLRAFCALTTSELWLDISGIVDRFLINLCLFIPETEEVPVVLAGWFAFLLIFIKFNRWKELLFGEHRVNLFYKLKCSILLIQYESVNRVECDWDLPSVKEKLKLRPVIPFATVVLCVCESMHADIRREVPTENLSDQEAVVERPTHIFDWVRQI